MLVGGNFAGRARQKQDCEQGGDLITVNNVDLSGLGLRGSSHHSKRYTGNG